MPKRQLRVNMVVTEEQHALLSELAELDPVNVRSAAGFMRDLLDRVTPLLRVQVPAMRAAAQELNTSREELQEPLRAFLVKMKQMDLLDPATLEPPEPQRSEDGRPKRRRRATPRSSTHGQ
jgi:hypothetical protein